MGLKIQGNDLQGAKIAISYRNTQGPCPKGFHIGSKDEWDTLIHALDSLGLYSVSDITTVLDIPSAYYLARSNGSKETRYGICRFWTSTMTSNTVAWARGIDQDNKFVFQEDKPGNAFSIRPFKDEPVEPDSSWTEEEYGVFKNTTLGLISIKWGIGGLITISDKNLGATNVGDNGLYYQFGNNTGYTYNASPYVTSKPTLNNEYGPGNYYTGSFVRVSSGNNWFNGTCNNIWGGVNPTGSWTEVKDVQEIYIGSTKIRPTEVVLFDFGDWTDSQWTAGPASTAQQGTITKTSTYISFYNSSNNASNYLSQYPIDGTKDFLLEFRGNIPNTSLSYHGIGITTVPGGNNIDFHTNRESTYRNKIWCETYDGTTTVRQGGETNPGTADYFIKKEGNVLTMGRNGAIKYTTSNFSFASTYYLNEGVYRSTATIYTAKLTYF